MKCIAKFISHLNNLYSTSNTKNGFGFTDTKIRKFAKKNWHLMFTFSFSFAIKVLFHLTCNCQDLLKKDLIKMQEQN